MSSLPALKPNPTLKDLQEYIAVMVRQRGFDGDDVAKRFMLLMEESGEFARAARKSAGLGFASDTNTSSLEEEAADVFILLLGICNMLDIDLEKAFRSKEEHNKRRTWR